VAICALCHANLAFIGEVFPFGKPCNIYMYMSEGRRKKKRKTKRRGEKYAE
jgi:hypothetical protein